MEGLEAGGPQTALFPEWLFEPRGGDASLETNLLDRVIVDDRFVTR